MLSHLECGLCTARHEADALQTVCRSCGGTLLARYSLAGLRHESVPRGRGLWDWADLLPVAVAEHRLSLGEGDTPLLPVGPVLVKDEGRNPTGTFKARGMCVAVARAVELGVQAFAVPTAGNAGVALAAYAARAGVRAHVFDPADVSARVVSNARALGADVTLVSGLLPDAARACAAFVAQHPGTLDVSTMREPFRVEGKKTMGFEIARDLAWELPDAIVYPAGGGTGIVGLAKAFDELRELAWTRSEAPRLYAIQPEGCAPLVRSLAEGKDTCEPWVGAHTAAHGLRVPKPFADRLVLRALRASGGGAVAVAEGAIAAGVAALGARGIFASPEGGAAWAGWEQLARDGAIRPGEQVVVFNTGSGLAT